MNKRILLIVMVSTLGIVLSFGQRYETSISISLNANNLVDDPNTLVGENIIFLAFGTLDSDQCSPTGSEIGTYDYYDICGRNLTFPGAPSYSSVSVSTSIRTNTNHFINGIRGGRLDAHTSFRLKSSLQNAGSNIFSVNHSSTISNFEYCKQYTSYDGNTGYSTVFFQVAELGKNLQDLNSDNITNNEVSCQESFQLQTNACGISAHFALEYQIRQGGATGSIVQPWSEALGYALRRPPTLSIADFPNLQEGQYLDLMLRYSENASSSNDDYSDILPLYFRSCSPQLTQPIAPIHTTCSYSTDGGFSMVLDRDLDNERLIVALYKEGTNGDELLDNDDTRGPLAPNGDGTYTYTWNGGALAQGTYKIKYQTDNEAEGSEIDPPPDSLEFSDSFTIGGPDPVTFVVETPTHVSCNGNTDGSVTLSANGGVGGYHYILNNGTAIPFTDTSKDASHVVNNLGPTSHTFKVQDADGCMAKE